MGGFRYTAGNRATAHDKLTIDIDVTAGIVADTAGDGAALDGQSSLGGNINATAVCWMNVLPVPLWKFSRYWKPAVQI